MVSVCDGRSGGLAGRDDGSFGSFASFASFVSIEWMMGLIEAMVVMRV